MVKDIKVKKEKKILTKLKTKNNIGNIKNMGKMANEFSLLNSTPLILKIEHQTNLEDKISFPKSNKNNKNNNKNSCLNPDILHKYEEIRKDVIRLKKTNKNVKYVYDSFRQSDNIDFLLKLYIYEFY